MKRLRWWIISGVLAMPVLVCIASVLRPGVFGISYASDPKGSTQEWRGITVRLNEWEYSDETFSCQPAAKGFPAPPGIYSGEGSTRYLLSIAAKSPPSTRFLADPIHRWHVPSGYLFLIAAVMPAVAFIRWLRTPRYPPGHCQKCGYDLRATPNRCPECGTVPPPGQS
jgi:hypothetical protein